MWPPSSEDSLLARTTIAIAFQRMIDRSRRSIWPRHPAGELRLALGRDRVHVRRGDAGDRAAAGELRALDRPRQDLTGAVGSVVLDDGIDGLEPLGGLDRVDVSSCAV